MRHLLTYLERRHARLTRRHNAKNHQPTRFAQAMTTRRTR